MKKKQYIYGLDILKTFGILLIIVYHFFPNRLPAGFIGVDVLFVISGFLTTKSIIFDQEEGFGFSIFGNLKKRFFRLFPAMCFVVLICSTVTIFWNFNLRTNLDNEFFSGLTFLENINQIIFNASYDGTMLPSLFKHLWAVALEFQFFIIQIAIFVIFYLLFDGRRKIFLFVIASLAFLLALFLLFYYAAFITPSRGYYGLDSHSLSLFLGMAVAIYVDSLKIDTERDIINNKPISIIWLIAIICGMIYIVFYAINGKFSNIDTFQTGIPITAIITAVSIFIIYKNQFFFKVVNFAPFRFIGERAFLYYLWHWPILVLLDYTDLKDIYVIALSAVITVVAAEITEILIAYPMLTLKNRRLLYRKKIYSKVLAGFIIIFLGISLYNIANSPFNSEYDEQLLNNQRYQDEKTMGDLNSPLG